jgi:hypothetical protein
VRRKGAWGEGSGWGVASVEFGLTSIERRRVVVALEPGVDEGDLLGPVVDDSREVASLKERLLLEVEGDHLVDAGVDVCAKRKEVSFRVENRTARLEAEEGGHVHVQRYLSVHSRPYFLKPLL